MKIINQRGPSDCTIACIAMLANESYDAVLAESAPGQMGQAHEVDRLMDAVGLECRREVRPELKPDQVYLLGVPSLNGKGKMHAVVLDTRGSKVKIYDPNNGREGKECYTDSLMPHGWGQMITILNPQFECEAE